MTIRSHKGFKKHFDKLTNAQKEKFEQRIGVFLQDEFHPILNNHALKGEYSGYRSINIGGDLRAVYRKLSEDEIFFLDIGSHSRLYE